MTGLHYAYLRRALQFQQTLKAGLSGPAYKYQVLCVLLALLHDARCKQLRTCKLLIIVDKDIQIIPAAAAGQTEGGQSKTFQGLPTRLLLTGHAAVP